MVCTILLFGLVPESVFAVSNNVSVTIPTFKITLNGTQVDNTYRKYPFLVYKGITYFPMTYYDCRFLGLETEWSAVEGLRIKQSDIASSYHQDKQTLKNSNNYSASVQTRTVKVNGKIIDSSRETYPLLSFRNVTYFPMTWRFCVNEFGWKYDFHATKGLTIQSGNAIVKEINLEIKPKFIDDESSIVYRSFTLAGGYFYYEGENGVIYQVPVDNPNKLKKVYQLPEWSYGSDGQLVWAGLGNEDGVAILHYHQGGAIMGYDVRVYFNNDGTYIERYDENTNIKVPYEDKTVFVYVGPFSDNGNMHITSTTGDAIQIGDPDCYYVGDLEVVGDDIYVRGRTYDEKHKEQYGIYQVNIKTNKTTLLTNQNVMTFEIMEDNIYFVGEDGTLNCRSLNGGNAVAVKICAQRLSQEFRPVFLHGSVFYVSTTAGKPMLYKLFTDASLNPGAEVTGLTEMNGYLLATFKEESSTKYRLMVFDKTGKAVLKTADVAQNVTIDNGTLCYINSEGKVCMTELPR